MYGNKIRQLRNLKNYSQEYMSIKLDIEQSSYSRIENEQQKLTAEMLQNIAKVLDVAVSDITNGDPIVINNQTSNNGTQGAYQYFYADQKETYQKLIDSKDEEIQRILKEKNQEIERLVKQNELLLKLLESKTIPT
jgi:transcriptional regulator with XRE-family HTH domain